MIIKQKMIYRVDMQANPRLLYIFGDNEARTGSGGQAKEMRGEPNVIGIRSKRKPLYDPDAYWYEADHPRQRKLVDEDFMAVVEALKPNASGASDYKGLVIPLEGIGTGMAQLKDRSPSTLRYIEKWIANLEYNFGG